jgi:hypothetical protein
MWMIHYLYGNATGAKIFAQLRDLRIGCID